MSADLSLTGHLWPYIASAYGLSVGVIGAMIFVIARDFYASRTAQNHIELAAQNRQQAPEADA